MESQDNARGTSQSFKILQISHDIAQLEVQAAAIKQFL
jgi:hypothetical protein